MANLTTKTFSQLVSDQATVVQGAAAGLTDFSVGSILRAFTEAVALVGLWLQAMLIQTVRMTRAATSSGADLDTWVADFGLTRAPAGYAAGDVTFGRTASANVASIPLGALVRSSDGSQTYVVIADNTKPGYRPATEVYEMAIGETSVAVRVRAQTAGAAANANPGAVNTISSTIVGVDTVTNTTAFTGGAGEETDTALRARFVAYMASLSKATHGAVAYAINSVQAGLTFYIADGRNPDGTPHPAFFFVVIDDGTGAPSQALLDEVGEAIDAVRAVGVSFAVFAPTILPASITAKVRVATGYDSATVTNAIRAAVTSYVNALGVGGVLHITRIAQIAYDTVPGAVTNVTAIQINSGTGDLVPTEMQVVKASLVTITAA